MTDDSVVPHARHWGLVLSGGAACGLANIGVLEVLHEAGLRPACIAGSSMGAIIAAPYAMGHPPAVLRRLLGSLAPSKVVRLSKRPLQGGLHGGLLQQQLESHLEPLVGDARIGDCVIPFVCVAGLVHGPVRWHQIMTAGFLDHLRERIEPYVFPPETKLIDAVRASSAIPVIFSPAQVNGRQFVDLLQFGAIPAESLRSTCAPEVIVATDTQPTYEGIEPWLPQALRRYLAAGRRELERSIAVCDLIIRPHLPATMLDFAKGDLFADEGIRAARDKLDAIRALLRSQGSRPAGSDPVSRP